MHATRPQRICAAIKKLPFQVDAASGLSVYEHPDGRWRLQWNAGEDVRLGLTTLAYLDPGDVLIHDAGRVAGWLNLNRPEQSSFLGSATECCADLEAAAAARPVPA